MTATTIDRTGPDGGYIIHDHGYYAEAEEYIRADELDPDFVKACGGPAPFTAGYIRMDRSLTLERRPLREYRTAIGCAGWRPRRREEIIEAMLIYGYGDNDNTGEWVAEIGGKPK